MAEMRQEFDNGKTIPDFALRGFLRFERGNDMISAALLMAITGSFAAGLSLFDGDDEDNRLEGTDADEGFTGGAGDDSIYAGAGNDIVVGGEGNDAVDASFGDDKVSGGDGDDAVYAGRGDDEIDLGAGDDTATGGRGDDILMGGEGNDVLAGDRGDDVLIAGDGEDTLTGGKAGTDLFVLDIGNPGNAITDLDAPDQIVINTTELVDPASVSVELQDDGTANVIIDGAVHVNVSGDVEDLLAEDILFRDLTQTDNTAAGILAGDSMLIEPANLIEGTDEDDVIDGTAGVDDIQAGAGDDIVNALEGNDNVFGGPGADILNGNEGDDRVSGGAGDDEVNGNDGDDRLFGGGNTDTISGGDGNDFLNSGAGTLDQLMGEAGDDILLAEALSVDTTMSGGEGTDTFIIEDGATGVEIGDLEAGEQIVIRFDGLPGVVEITQQGEDQALITVNPNDPELAYVINVSGSGAAALTLDDIIIEGDEPVIEPPLPPVEIVAEPEPLPVPAA